MRLTEKDGTLKLESITDTKWNKAIIKLGQLEDIEDELGIDLITYFKLINAENIYSYGHTNIMKNTGQVDIYDRTITIWNGSCHQTYPLSEYGKSFALTKEELLQTKFIYGVARINENAPFITFTTFKDADEFAKTNKNIDNLVVVKLEEDKWTICVDEYRRSCYDN